MDIFAAHLEGKNYTIKSELEKDIPLLTACHVSTTNTYMIRENEIWK